MKRLLFLLCTMLLSINVSAQIVNVQPLLLVDKILDKQDKKDNLNIVIEVFDKNTIKVTKNISKKITLQEVMTEEFTESVKIPKGNNQEEFIVGLKFNGLLEKVDTNIFNLTYDLKFGDLTDTEIIEANIEGSLNFKINESKLLFENDKKRIILKLING